jgi:hypothetical protein
MLKFRHFKAVLLHFILLWFSPFDCAHAIAYGYLIHALSELFLVKRVFGVDSMFNCGEV